jgi:hypothetical protein
MKAKSLLLAGAVVFASAAGAMAQGTVFSVNAVGFVNKTFPPNQFVIAANPLLAADNNVTNLFQNVPNLSTLSKWNPTTQQFVNNTYFTGFGWLDKTMSLVPGEAFFFKNSDTSTGYAVTFVGNVSQGSLTNSLVPGFNLVSSQVPQSGGVTTDLALPINNLEVVSTFDGSKFDNYTYFTGFGWLGPNSQAGEPQIAVGQGFFVKKTQATAWTRNFSVNN